MEDVKELRDISIWIECKPLTRLPRPVTGKGKSKSNGTSPSRARPRRRSRGKETATMKRLHRILSESSHHAEIGVQLPNFLAGQTWIQAPDHIPAHRQDRHDTAHPDPDGRPDRTRIASHHLHARPAGLDALAGRYGRSSTRQAAGHHISLNDSSRTSPMPARACGSHAPLHPAR